MYFLTVVNKAHFIGGSSYENVSGNSRYRPGFGIVWLFPVMGGRSWQDCRVGRSSADIFGRSWRRSLGCLRNFLDWIGSQEITTLLMTKDGMTGKENAIGEAAQNDPDFLARILACGHDCGRTGKNFTACRDRELMGHGLEAMGIGVPLADKEAATRIRKS